MAGCAVARIASDRVVGIGPGKQGDIARVERVPVAEDSLSCTPGTSYGRANNLTANTVAASIATVRQLDNLFGLFPTVANPYSMQIAGRIFMVLFVQNIADILRNRKHPLQPSCERTVSMN